MKLTVVLKYISPFKPQTFSFNRNIAFSSNFSTSGEYSTKKIKLAHFFLFLLFINFSLISSFFRFSQFRSYKKTIRTANIIRAPFKYKKAQSALSRVYYMYEIKFFKLLHFSYPIVWKNYVTHSKLMFELLYKCFFLESIMVKLFSYNLYISFF